MFAFACIDWDRRREDAGQVECPLRFRSRTNSSRVHRNTHPNDNDARTTGVGAHAVLSGCRLRQVRTPPPPRRARSAHIEQRRRGSIPPTHRFNTSTSPISVGQATRRSRQRRAPTKHQRLGRPRSTERPHEESMDKPSVKQLTRRQIDAGHQEHAPSDRRTVSGRRRQVTSLRATHGSHMHGTIRSNEDGPEGRRAKGNNNGSQPESTTHRRPRLHVCLRKVRKKNRARHRRAKGPTGAKRHGVDQPDTKGSNDQVARANHSDRPADGRS
jgi:hypothetical protein